MSLSCTAEFRKIAICLKAKSKWLYLVSWMQHLKEGNTKGPIYELDNWNQHLNREHQHQHQHRKGQGLWKGLTCPFQSAFTFTFIGRWATVSANLTCFHLTPATQPTLLMGVTGSKLVGLRP